MSRTWGRGSHFSEEPFPVAWNVPTSSVLQLGFSQTAIDWRWEWKGLEVVVTGLGAWPHASGPIRGQRFLGKLLSRALLPLLV